MDFLKTLLAYMTLLATLGIQEGPAPETIPTPTPLPVHITASPVPFQTAAPTATPAPTGSAASTPAPTDNSIIYLTPGPTVAFRKQLKYESKGETVKEVQRRLTDLGYYEGNISGNFLGHTRNAVKALQTKNNLKALLPLF